jgi:hypothetical protein
MMEVSPLTTPELPLLAMLGYAVSALGGVACLVLGVIVGVKIMNKYGTGPGVAAIILAVLCNLATFIWGWVKVKELQIGNLMKWYTIGFIVSVIGGILCAAGIASAGVSMGQQMQIQMQESIDQSQEAMREREAEAATEEAQRELERQLNEQGNP